MAFGTAAVAGRSSNSKRCQLMNTSSGPTYLYITLSAFQHLLNLIRSSLIKSGAKSPDFAQRLAHLDELARSANSLARKFRSGMFARASGERVPQKPVIVAHHFKRVISAYRKNAATHLRLFSGVYP